MSGSINSSSVTVSNSYIVSIGKTLYLFVPLVSLVSSPHITKPVFLSTYIPFVDSENCEPLKFSI